MVKKPENLTPFILSRKAANLASWVSSPQAKGEKERQRKVRTNGMGNFMAETTG
jgi:hypothetical protein